MDMVTKIFHDTCSGKLPSDSFQWTYRDEKDPVVYFGICVPVYSQIHHIPQFILVEINLCEEEALIGRGKVVNIQYRIVEVLGADSKYLDNHDEREMKRAKKIFLLDLAKRYVQNFTCYTPGISDEQKLYFEDFFKKAKLKLRYPDKVCKDVKQHLEEIGENNSLTRAYLEIGMASERLPKVYYEKNADIYDTMTICGEKVFELYQKIPREMQQTEAEEFLGYVEDALGIEFLGILISSEKAGVQ